MTQISQSSPPSPVRMPVCPSCIKPMRLRSGARDKTYANLRHVMFVCDNCGRASDQVLADHN
jgi:transposase-like protein